MDYSYKSTLKKENTIENGIIIAFGSFSMVPLGRKKKRRDNWKVSLETLAIRWSFVLYQNVIIKPQEVKNGSCNNEVSR